jgi:hypothetical protein
MMRRVLLAAVLAAVTLAVQAQSIENFNWLDLRQPGEVQTIVARALIKEPYTELREIGFIGNPTREEAAAAAAAAQATTQAAAPIAAPGGAPNPAPGGAPNPAQPAAAQTIAPRLSVPRDAHLLVITAERANPAALPEEDVFRAYDVDQRQISATLLLQGPELKLLGWLRMRREGAPELVATYNDCVVCQRTTFFTSFYIDGKTHQWQTRWPRARAGAPIFSEGQEANGCDQVYGLLSDEAGRVMLGTWAHYSGRGRTDSDYVYAYRVENYGSREAAQPLAGTEAHTMEQRLCRGQGVLFGLGSGQDSPLCHALVGTSAPPSLETRRRRRAQ